MLQSNYLCRRLVLRAQTLVPVAVICMACGEPTGPDATSLLKPTMVMQSNIASARVGFTDASERLLPALADQKAAHTLAKAFSAFSTAFDSGDLKQAQRALAEIRQGITSLEESEHPVNLSAIRLSLLQAESLLADGETDSKNP